MVKLIGILNLTPDSFSDGGCYTTVHAALAQAERLIAEGAAVIDVGAESTRPGALSLSAAEEWQRIAPVIGELKPLLAAHDVLLSIDTRHAATAEKAIGQGADWINDVSGGDSAAMRKVIAASAVTLVIMHHCGIPANPAVILPEGCDVVQVLTGWFEQKMTQLDADNISRERLILDPGIGFGKNAAQSWAIIDNISALQQLGLPLLVGHSRKSFLGGAGGNRDSETYRVTAALAAKGVEYLRVHDVAGNWRALEGMPD